MTASAPTPPSLSVLRIIILAMACGLLVVAILVALLDSPKHGSISADTLSVVLALMSVGSAAVYLIMRKVLPDQFRRQGSSSDAPPLLEDTAMKTYAVLTIIGAALAESVGLLAAVAAWLCDQPAFLGVTKTSILAMFLILPTQSGLDRLQVRMGDGG